MGVAGMERAIYALAAAIFVAGLAMGGLHELSADSKTDGPVHMWRMNRLTGAVAICFPRDDGVVCFKEQ